MHDDVDLDTVARLCIEAVHEHDLKREQLVDSYVQQLIESFPCPDEDQASTRPGCPTLRSGQYKLGRTR